MSKRGVIFVVLSVQALSSAIFPGYAAGEMIYGASHAYPNYRELMIAMLDARDLNMPADIEHRLNSCGADVAVEYLTQAELARLDSWAQRKQKLDTADLEKINADVGKRYGGRKGMEVLMRQHCPDVFREAEAFKAAND